MSHRPSIIIIGFVIELPPPLSSIIVVIFTNFTQAVYAQDGQRDPKDIQREPKGPPKGATGREKDKTEVMTTQPKRNTSFIHQLEPWNIHPDDVVGNVLQT